jgi:hypothetical protein
MPQGRRAAQTALEIGYEVELREAGHSPEAIDRLMLGRRLNLSRHYAEQYGRPVRLPSVKRTRSMVLVSKQLGAEYRCVFYQRTKFFFRLIRQNLSFRLGDIGPDAYDYTVAPLPPFWSVSPELVASLCQCTLYIELRGVENVCISNEPNPSRFNRYMQPMDEALTGAVQAFLRPMRQLRSIQLVWATHFARHGPPEDEWGTIPATRAKIVQYNSDMFSRAFMKTLMAKPNLQRFVIRMGSCEEAMEITARRLDGQWWYRNTQRVWTWYGCAEEEEAR